METVYTPTTTGPDLSHCGQAVDWKDRVGLSDDFKRAANVAFEMLEFDIELARWSVDDIHAPQYVGWWNNQRQMLRRYLRTMVTDESVSFVVHRRTDTGDGFVKCYVRIEGGEAS